MGHAEKIWLLLIGLTGAGAWLGETGHSSWALAFVIAGLIALKGRLVLDHYMEMTSAKPHIRHVLYASVAIVLALVLVSHGWSDALRRLTTLN
jgi:hypothetical protein